MDSAIYQNRVLGEFYAGDEDTVIPLAWAEAAVARWHAWEDAGRRTPASFLPRTVGVDVARTGAGPHRPRDPQRPGDHGAAPVRPGKTPWQPPAGSRRILDADDSCTAVVDVIGIGAGVVDRLREQHAKVIAFNASKGTKLRDSTREFWFKNCRSAAWWTMRTALDPSGDPDICLPDDEMLLGDLSAPHWEVTSGGRIQVEGKDDIRKRIGRSTDDGDAVVQAFVPHLGVYVSAGVRKWAGAVDLEQTAGSEDSMMRRRLRGAHGGLYAGQETPEDAPWDLDGLDGFAPQDDDQRPENGRRGNVRAWR